MSQKMAKISISSIVVTMTLVLAMITASVFNSGYLPVLAKGGKSSDSNSNSGGSDSGSSNGPGGGSDGDSKGSDTPSNDNKGVNNKSNQPAGTNTPSAGSEEPSDKNTKDSPIIPANPSGGEINEPGVIKKCDPVPCEHIPGQDCAFHPDSPRCAPDHNGNCPTNFGKNDNGNCFPSGPCPNGSGRHDNDETGKCFPNNPGNFCHFHNCGPCSSIGIHFHTQEEFRCIPPVHCPSGFDNEHGVCIKHIFTVIKSHSSSVSSGSSHSLSNNCFDAIKIAWIGKIHRGENHDVDKIIDRCLGV